MKKRLIGIDVGGTTIKIAFLTWSGEIISKWEIPTNTVNKGENILTDISESIKQKIVDLSMNLADFHAAGVGVPGPVQLNVGYLPEAVNLGGFGGFNVNDTLSVLLGIPVITDNDANVAAIGEMWLGGGGGADNIAFYTLGTGVGGGLITNGQIISGFSGAGGEIGHMPIVTPDDPLYIKCNCKATGCLETVCSATGIVRIGMYYLENNNGHKTCLHRDDLTAKTIFDAAKKDDILALKIVDRFAQYLGKSLELLSVTINPEVFVIGGGVSNAGEILITAVEKYYGTNIFPATTKNVSIVSARLGNDAGVIGAAKHARGVSVYE
ncbi:glucokinase [Erysipelotrichaceae bacterium]|nr:glucokinase [Erysipelotrichaceae bacterium]